MAICKYCKKEYSDKVLAVHITMCAKKPKPRKPRAPKDTPAKEPGSEEKK